MFVAMALPLAYAGLVHPWPLSNHVSGNGFVICLHWPASCMALFNVIATILFFTYLHGYIMVVAMGFLLYFH